MRAVVQRVSRASVRNVEGETPVEVGKVGMGFLVLVGVKSDDAEEDARFLAEKVANLRVFEDEEGKLNRALVEVGGGALVVSNFTLYGDCRKGRRPSFTEAAPGAQAETLYRKFGELLAAQGVTVEYGAFGAMMEIEQVNTGPITLLLDSRRGF